MRPALDREAMNGAKRSDQPPTATANRFYFMRPAPDPGAVKRREAL